MVRLWCDVKIYNYVNMSKTYDEAKLSIIIMQQRGGQRRYQTELEVQDNLQNFTRKIQYNTIKSELEESTKHGRENRGFLLAFFVILILVHIHTRSKQGVVSLVRFLFAEVALADMVGFLIVDGRTQRQRRTERR